MNQYEYKTVRVPLKGLFKKDLPSDFDSTLNAEGKEGWKLVDSVVSTGELGEVKQVVLIFIRESQ